MHYVSGMVFGERKWFLKREGLRKMISFYFHLLNNWLFSSAVWSHPGADSRGPCADEFFCWGSGLDQGVRIPLVALHGDHRPRVQQSLQTETERWGTVMATYISFNLLRLRVKMLYYMLTLSFSFHRSLNLCFCSQQQVGPPVPCAVFWRRSGERLYIWEEHGVLYWGGSIPGA